MKQISVITDTEALHDSLVSKLEACSGNKIASYDNEGLLEITSCDDEDDLKVMGAISSVIAEHYCEKLISKIVNQNYFYLNLYEKKIIFEKAVCAAKGENIELIRNKLDEYLKTTDSVVLDGFVNFRLSDYIKRLERIVDVSADEFIIEREYEDFISLLRTFAEMQTPAYEVIHIVPENGEYRLYDEGIRDITMACMSEFMQNEAEDKMNSDDLLISILISMAPESICIHKSDRIKNKELLNTVCRVFEGKIIECNSCILCGG